MGPPEERSVKLTVRGVFPAVGEPANDATGGGSVTSM